MAQTNAERQKAFRDRQRARRDAPVDPEELAALTELLDSALAAGALIDTYGDIRTALAAPAVEVREMFHWLPDAYADRVVRKLAALRGTLQAFHRAELREPDACALTLDAWNKVVAYLVAHYSKTEETFHCLYLDRKNALLHHEKQAGTIGHCQVYPREIVRKALEIGSCALVLAHNHPSGDAAPSRGDIAVTRDIVAVCKLVDVAVHDHIIVGRDGNTTSFRELGLI